jgi:hypothetical protein
MAAMASTTAAQRGDHPPSPSPHTCTHSVCVLHMRGGGEEEAAGAS